MAKDHAIVVSEDPEILIKVWKLNKDDEIKFIRPIDGMWLETSKGFIVTQPYGITYEDNQTKKQKQVGWSEDSDVDFDGIDLLAYSEAHNLVAWTAYSRLIEIWSIETGNKERTLELHNGDDCLTALIFS